MNLNLLLQYHSKLFQLFFKINLYNSFLCFKFDKHLKLKIMKTIKFPDDFTKEHHALAEYYPGSLQFKYPKEGKTIISVIFGDTFYSNGIDTYEMYDFREDDPQGYLTVEEINKHLSENPIEL